MNRVTGQDHEDTDKEKIIPGLDNNQQKVEINKLEILSSILGEKVAT